MNKGILIGGVIVIAGGLTAPFFCGNAIESKFDKHVKDFRTALIQIDPSLNIEQTEYSKGWFSSTATTVITIDRHKIPVQHKITHGPWGYFGLGKVESQLAFNDQEQKIVDSLFAGKQPLLVTTNVGFSGNKTIELYSAPIDNKPIPESPDTIVNWGGMTGSFKISGNHITTDLNMPKLSINDTDIDKTVEMVNLQLKGGGGYTNDVNKLASIDWSSDSSISIDKLMINAHDGTYAAKIALNSASTDDNTNIGFNFTLKLTDIVLPQDVKMSIDGELVELGIGFNGLPKQPLVEFVKKIDNIQQQGRTPTDSEVMSLGQNFAIAFLQGTPSVTGHALVTSKQGDISLKAEAKLATADTSASEITTLAMTAMHRLHITVEPSFSESLIDVAINEGQLPTTKDEFIRTITEKNRFILNNGKFSGKFEFKQGQFYSNGQLDAELQRNLPYMLPRGIF